MQAETSEFHELSPSLRKYQLHMKNVAVNVFTGMWGTILNQHVKLDGNNYNEQYVATNKDVSTHFITTLPVAALLITVNGALNFNYKTAAFGMSSGEMALIYLAPHQDITIVFPKEQHSQNIVIELSRDLLISLSDSHPMLTNMLTAVELIKALPTKRFTKTIQVEINKLKNSDMQGKMGERYFDNRISDIIILYMKQMNADKQQDHHQIQLYQAEILLLIAAIDKHPHESFNVKKEAVKLGITQRALQNAFKEKLGETVMQYVISRRVIKARGLLESTERTIKDISLEVGYADPALFNKLFKQVTGSTPGLYRSNNKAV